MTDGTTADREHGLGAVRRGVAAFDREDPRLAPVEKETLFRFSRADDRLEFYTAERGIGRRLLAHPAATIDEVTIVAGERARPAVELGSLDPDDQVVAVRGSLPIGSLKIRERARTSGGHAGVVTEDVLEEVTP